MILHSPPPAQITTGQRLYLKQCPGGSARFNVNGHDRVPVREGHVVRVQSIIFVDEDDNEIRVEPSRLSEWAQIEE